MGTDLIHSDKQETEIAALRDVQKGVLQISAGGSVATLTLLGFLGQHPIDGKGWLAATWVAFAISVWCSLVAQGNAAVLRQESGKGFYFWPAMIGGLSLGVAITTFVVFGICNLY